MNKMPYLRFLLFFSSFQTESFRTSEKDFYSAWSILSEEESDGSIASQKRRPSSAQIPNKNFNGILGRHTTPTTTTIKDTRDPRISRPRFRPVKMEVQTLIPLAKDVAEFVATYKRPHQTTKHAFRFVHWRRATKQKVVTNRTKYVTKYYQTKKRMYPSNMERRDVIYKHFVNTLSLFNETKKELLTISKGQVVKDQVVKDSSCYMNAYSTFLNSCDYAFFNWGTTSMKKLLARACEANWLTTEDIICILRRCCQSRFKYLHIGTA